MAKGDNILIKNIYYMLCFVFEALVSTVSKSRVDCEEFEDIYDLFALILYMGISKQLKRGLYKEYEDQCEELTCVRGKINLSNTIKYNTLLNKRVYCEFSEYTENSYCNQVLKSTCEFLLKQNIKLDTKRNLNRVLLYFQTVQSIRLKDIDWKKIVYHRNNLTYKMLINICYLIVNNSLMNQDDGHLLLDNFTNSQLERLFEKFVFNYYKQKHSELSVNSPYVDWDVSEDINIEFMPKMRTDVVLTDKQNKDHKLIIDTKFYNHSYQNRYDSNTYHSNNLYQIFTYVKNEDKNNSGNVKGMLIYAKTKDELETPEKDFFKINGNEFSVSILDLNQDWDFIQKKLENIILSWLNSY